MTTLRSAYPDWDTTKVSKDLILLLNSVPTTELAKNKIKEEWASWLASVEKIDQIHPLVNETKSILTPRDKNTALANANFAHTCYWEINNPTQGRIQLDGAVTYVNKVQSAIDDVFEAEIQSTKKSESKVETSAGSKPAAEAESKSLHTAHAARAPVDDL